MSGTSESTGRLSATSSSTPSKTGRHALLGIFLIGPGILLVRVFFPLLPGVTDGELHALVLILALASTLTSLSGQLPVQNVMLASVVIGVIGGGVQLISAFTNIPFGPIVYNQEAGPQLFGTMSWAIPFIWILVILNSRGVARLILRPWRKLRVYGYWLIGLTTLLALLFDCGLEPYATRQAHFWFWRPTRFPIDWYGTPLSNFLGWLVTSLLVLAFATPSLMKKKPSRSTRDYHPLIVWISLNLLFIAGSASQGLWPATAISGIACAGIIPFAIRGARW